jgi:hypothetical protein
MEMEDKATVLASKLFDTIFDEELLDKMQRTKCIAQIRGFKVSCIAVMALELEDEIND